MVEHRSTGLKFWPFMLLLALMAGCGTPSAPEAPAAEEAPDDVEVDDEEHYDAIME